MLPFLLSGGLSLGASFLASLFGPGQKPITQSFRNQQETWNVPASQYGTEIPTLYGTYRVQGTYVAAQIPPDYETDSYFDPVRREEIQTLIYYGSLGVLWGRIPKTDSGINVTANPDVEKIWGNKILLYQNGQIDSIFGEYWGRFEGLSVNNYFHDNNPDAYLAFMGANQIAYWGRCYSVLHRLRLNNSDGKLFNGNYPGLEAEISTGVTSLGMMIRHICWQHGLNVTTGANSEVNTSELDSIEIKGYATKSGSLGEKLLAAQIAYSFWPIDVGNQLKFIKQYRANVSAYIGLENLAAHESGGKAQELFICEETPVSELPTQVRVRFRDINLNYQENSRVSFEINLENRQNLEDLDLTQLVLTETEALNIANRHLQLRWLRRFTYRLSVLGNYAYLEAGDVITVGFSTGSQNLQITRINTAANGLISIEAYPYDAQVFGYSYLAPAPQSASSSITQGTPAITGQTNLYSVNSVTNQDGTATYTEGVDYTVNLTNGTVTPIIGGGIPNGSTIIINYQGQATPQTPVTPPVIPPPAVNSYPKILSFSPTQGRIGDAITIYGENFTGATSASINGVAVGSFVVVSDGVITGVIGNGTTTGKVSVTSPSGTGESLTDFVIVTGGDGGHTILDEGIELIQRSKLDFIGERITAIDDELNDTTKIVLDPPQWGDIEGVPTDQSDLWGYLSRSWRYAVTVGSIVIPALNGTVDVEVSDASYFIPNAGQRITVKLDNDYCQFILLGVAGNILTLQRDIICQSSGTTLSAGAYVFSAWEPRDIHGGGLIATAGSVDGVLTAGNSKYYGTNETGVPGFYDLPSGVTKSKTIESISATKTLTLNSGYFQFLTPTVASVIVKLPAVTGSDYFECEIANQSTTNALAIQENNGTAIITLANTGDKNRSIYAFWDGATWQVWIRGYY